jgi:phosphoenolpyruvate-protein kinase (PTS system EI component)
MGDETAGGAPPARFHGVPVSAGTAAGILRIVADSVVGGASVAATPEQVAAAFTRVAADRSALAERLRKAGRTSEAEIISIGALIAGDPALSAPAVSAVQGGADAVTAVREAAERQAELMEKLDNPALASRAADIRQVGVAVIDRLRATGGASAGAALEVGAEPEASRGGDAGREAGAGRGPDGPAGLGDEAAIARGSAGGAGARPDADDGVRDFILVRHEVTPSDLIELAEAGLVGAVSVAGGASSHASIVARGLGVPMITGASPDVLSLAPGQAAVLDGTTGELLVGAQEVADAAQAADADRAAAAAVIAGHRAKPDGPARTSDGRQITVLCNVASAVETRRGLAAGADGVGLLRTELPYVQASGWPTLEQDRAQLGPILELLAGKTATVRVLDFSGDKIPPFLATGAYWGRSDVEASGEIGAGGSTRSGGAGRTEAGGAGGAEEISLPAGAGLAALLKHPSALADQLRAMLEAGRSTHLEVLIPMVSSLREVSRVRNVLTETAAELDVEVPPLGIMVELESTAKNAAVFASAVDFFSIGTNDLTGDVLGLGRRDPAAGPGLAAHPRVLALVKLVAKAGREAGITVSVCGDAAGDPRVLPLLIGAGVKTVSVPAARVATVRSDISKLNFLSCKQLTERALLASSAAEVWDMVPPL